MDDQSPKPEIDALQVRTAWRDLVEVRLPRLAAGRGWPLTEPASFERVILDTVVGPHWSETLGYPSWNTVSVADLALAIELGHGLIDGVVTLERLDRRSRQARAMPEGWDGAALAERDDAELLGLAWNDRVPFRQIAAEAGLSEEAARALLRDTVNAGLVERLLHARPDPRAGSNGKGGGNGATGGHPGTGPGRPAGGGGNGRRGRHR